MTAEAKRTVAAERDLPRIRAWLNDVLRHAVDDAARSFSALRYWADHSEATLADSPGDRYAAGYLAAVRHVRSLLPDLPRTSGSPAGEVTSDAQDASERRPGDGLGP